MTAEMAPYLLFGFAIAGLLSVCLKREWVERQLGGRGFWSSLKAALVGIPMPLCSCSVIAVAASLRKQGAGKGATASFLSATPQTGVDSIAVTYAAFSWPITVVKVIVAFVGGVFTGWLIDLNDKQLDKDDTAPEGGGETKKSCCHSEEGSKEKQESSCCSSESKKESQKESCCSESEEEETSCCHSKEEHSHAEKSCCAQGGAQQSKLKEAWRYATYVLPSDIGKPLLLGLVISGLLSAFLPDDFFMRWLDNPWLTYGAVTLVSVPLYICATGSVPVAASLMAAGLSPGAALVLLVAGPATNAATIATLWHSLGRHATVVYVMVIMVTAWASGVCVDYLLPEVASSASAHAAHMEDPAMWQHVSAVVLLLLLGYAIAKKSRASIH